MIIEGDLCNNNVNVDRIFVTLPEKKLYTFLYTKRRRWHFSSFQIANVPILAVIESTLSHFTIQSGSTLTYESDKSKKNGDYI